LFTTFYHSHKQNPGVRLKLCFVDFNYQIFKKRLILVASETTCG